MLGYMARDQFGNTFHLGNVKYPRRALLMALGGTKATPMFVDTDYGSKQVGWVIKGHWCKVYEVHELKAK